MDKFHAVEVLYMYIASVFHCVYSFTYCHAKSVLQWLWQQLHEMCHAGQHVLGNGRPPQPQQGMSQSNPGFASHMVPMLQARPGSSTMGQPYQGQVGAAGMPASSFMPISQQIHPQSSTAQMSSMQPLLQNGAMFPSSSGHMYQWGSSAGMPQFQTQTTQQQHQQQQMHVPMQQPAQFGMSTNSSTTQAGFGSSMASTSQRPSTAPQNV